MSASRTGLALGALVLAQGCIALSDFEPVGPGSSIRGSWTIDGQPPTAERCEDLGTDLPDAPPRSGASLVRVVFLDGLRPVVHGNLLFQCATGSFDIPQKVVAEGDWMVRMQAVDSSNNVLDSGPIEPISSSMGGNVALTAVDFGSAQISARWTVHGQPASIETCNEIGVDEIELSFAGADAPGPYRELCAVGIAGRHLRAGSYDVSLRALGPGGVIAQYGPETFVLAPEQHRRLGGDAAIDLP